MEHLFQIISFSTASIIGLISILFSIISQLNELWEARKKLNKADEISFKAVLSSDNILTLGKYLDDTLSLLRNTA